MLRTVLVTGHGSFASGIVSAVELIMGPQAGLLAVDFPESDDVAQLREHLAAAFATACASDEGGRLVVCCDLRGGSPFNVSLELATGRSDIELVHGANLPLLLDVMARDATDDPGSTLIDSVAEARVALDRVVRGADGAESPDDEEWA